MREVYTRLHVGNQDDCTLIQNFARGGEAYDGWAIVHACKEPHHREMLGYTGRAAPKDHPEYLFGFRGNRLVLNLVDVDDPKYVNRELIDAAMGFIGQNILSRSVLVHCNQGRSRSPTIAMLYLGTIGVLSSDFDSAESKFRELYPDYAPARGMSEFASANWSEYWGRDVMCGG